MIDIQVQIPLFWVDRYSHGRYNDSWFICWHLPSSDLLNEEPRGRKERKPDEKYDVKCLKMNNNHIQDASSLFEVARDIILQPEAITWIDLSFNSLQKIDPVWIKRQLDYFISFQVVLNMNVETWPSPDDKGPDVWASSAGFKAESRPLAEQFHYILAVKERRW